MSKLEKGYGSRGIQAVLGDVKTYFEGELTKKANTSVLPDKITTSEAHDDFEAVFGSGTTGNPNLITASSTVFDSSDVTIVDP